MSSEKICIGRVVGQVVGFDFPKTRDSEQLLSRLNAPHRAETGPSLAD
jgi:hypothetical protein